MEQNDLITFHRLVKSDNGLESIHTFLVNGMDPNARDGIGNTPLHSAAESLQENTRIIRELINFGADVNLRSSSGFTPLHDAVNFQKRQMVEVLLESGADVNARAPGRLTALHIAVESSEPEYLDQPSVCLETAKLGPHMEMTEIVKDLLARGDYKMQYLGQNTFASAII